jgi:hypothetical protein
MWQGDAPDIPVKRPITCISIEYTRFSGDIGKK